MPLKVTCIAPSGRLTVPSEPTLPLGEPPVDAASGCHAFTHVALVELHFPFFSPERLYRVKPCESTSTAPPSDETDAVFTTAVPAPPLDCEADGEELLLLLELLPQAASNKEDTATAGMNFVI